MTQSPNGRKALPAIAETADPGDMTKIAKGSKAADAVGAANAAVAAHQDLFVMLGRIEVVEFYRNISEKMMLDFYQKAREAFSVIGEVTFRQTNGSVTRFADVDDFCRTVLHRSERRIQQIAAANRLLGEELYAQSQEMGLRARDYQAIKALPDDQQAAVRLAIEAGNKQAVLDIIQDMAEAQADLKRSMGELSKTAAAKDAVIKKKNEKIDALTEAEERRLSGTLDEREQAQLDDLRTTGLAAEMAVRKLAAAAGRVVNAPATEASLTAARQALEFVVQVLAGLIADVGVDVDVAGTVTPPWLTGTTPPAAKQ